METYIGGCQCGKVRFEASLTMEYVIECNCSHCFKKGLILTFIPKAQFILRSSEDALVEYRFNTKKLGHMSCATCSVQVFATGKNKDGGDTIAVNLRAIDDIDLSTLTTHKYNGKDV